MTHMAEITAPDFARGALGRCRLLLFHPCPLIPARRKNLLTHHPLGATL